MFWGLEMFCFPEIARKGVLQPRGIPCLLEMVGVTCGMYSWMIKFRVEGQSGFGIPNINGSITHEWKNVGFGSNADFFYMKANE